MESERTPHPPRGEPPQAVTPGEVAELLRQYWQSMERLADLLEAGGDLGAGFCVGQVRQAVLGCMVALNGARLPADLSRIEAYLGPEQQAAMARTLVAPAANRRAWIGQAVALAVIYQWYEPQLAEKYGLDLSRLPRARIRQQLASRVAGWPAAITTEV